VTLLGWYLFDERVAPVFWVGVALITTGILLVHYGSVSP